MKHRSIRRFGRLAAFQTESANSVRSHEEVMGLNRLRLRGPNGAKDEFTLAATAQNLRKIAKLLPEPV